MDTGGKHQLGKSSRGDDGQSGMGRELHLPAYALDHPVDHAGGAQHQPRSNGGGGVLTQGRVGRLQLQIGDLRGGHAKPFQRGRHPGGDGDPHQLAGRVYCPADRSRAKVQKDHGRAVELDRGGGVGDDVRPQGGGIVHPQADARPYPAPDVGHGDGGISPQLLDGGFQRVSQLRHHRPDHSGGHGGVVASLGQQTAYDHSIFVGGPSRVSG